MLHLYYIIKLREPKGILVSSSFGIFLKINIYRMIELYIFRFYLNMNLYNIKNPKSTKLNFIFNINKSCQSTAYKTNKKFSLSEKKKFPYLTRISNQFRIKDFFPVSESTKIRKRNISIKPELRNEILSSKNILSLDRPIYRNRFLQTSQNNSSKNSTNNSINSFSKKHKIIIRNKPTENKASTVLNFNKLIEKKSHTAFTFPKLLILNENKTQTMFNMNKIKRRNILFGNEKDLSIDKEIEECRNCEYITNDDVKKACEEENNNSQQTNNNEKNLYEKNINLASLSKVNLGFKNPVEKCKYRFLIDKMSYIKSIGNL